MSSNNSDFLNKIFPFLCPSILLCVYLAIFWERLTINFEYFFWLKKNWSPLLSVLSALERKQAAFTAFRLYKTAAALVCCSPSAPIIRVHFEQCWGCTLKNMVLLVALIFNPLHFCLLLCSEVGIYSFPLDTDSSFVTLWQWKVKSTMLTQHVYCLQLFLWRHAAQFWSWSNTVLPFPKNLESHEESVFAILRC